MTGFRKLYLLALAGSMAVFSACREKLADYPLVKLGAGTKDFLVEVDGGVVNIPVYSNGPYHLNILSEDAGWLKLTMPEDLSQNGYIRAECDFNESFRRQVVFTLNSDVDDRKDTVIFRQKGLKLAQLAIDNMSLLTKGAGGEETFTITTNIPSEDIGQAITYATEADAANGWIKSLAVEGEEDGPRTLRLVTDGNPSEDTPRSARVKLSFTDGWGESVSLSLNVIQRTALEKVGTPVSMATLKYELVESGKPIDQYVIVEGIVVSNKEMRNAGDNEQITPSAIDYTQDQRTIYLESEDGAHGISLICASAEDNITKPYQHVQILLFGTFPTLYDEPSYLVVSGVTASMFVSQREGTSFDVPSKERYIRDLTDDDIFTYVKLKDVEIPIRKGDLLPMNEGYTIATNAHRMNKFPRLIRDINGDDMYLLTNTTCQFRNDGTMLPYGRGSISGVIVHERYPRYEWQNLADPLDIDQDPNLGRIGTYQIRPQIKDDVWNQMQTDVESSFSKLLLEYRFWNPDETAGVQRPTYGTNGWFTHTYQRRYTGSESKDFTEAEYNQHMNATITWDYIGPKGKGSKHMFGDHPGNLNGQGIILDPDKEHWNRRMDALVDFTNPQRPEWCGPNAASEFVTYVPGTYGSINYTNSSNFGKGFVPSECYSAFQSNYWWDYEKGKPYSWLLNFSTTGISASQLSLQISVINTSQTFYTPRYWKLEWATTDDQNDYNWTLIDTYTVPDVGVWSTALYHSIVGFKQINFRLPLEMLGKENVYLRMSPENDICSSGADYADARMIDATEDNHTSAISYIAIRYN